MMYQAAIFDLDGTLLDTIQDLANAGNFTCTQMGWKPYSIAEYKQFVGNGIPHLVKKLCPYPDKLTTTEFELALKIFLERYNAYKSQYTKPYADICTLLSSLNANNIPIAVLTNKEDTLAQQIVAQYFPYHSFALVQGSLHRLPAKPNPTLLLRMLQTPAFEGKNTLFIGDSNVDVFTAQNAKIDCCGVLWGFRDEQELLQAGAKHLISQPLQLLSLFDTTTD